MALEVYPIDVILLLSFDIELCSVGIWSILVHISWHLLLVLATNIFFWEVPASYIDLYILYPLIHDFPSEFLPISSCYLVYRLFLLYRPLCLLLRLGHSLSLVLKQLLSLLLHFSWFLWCCNNHLLLKDKWSHNEQSSPMGYQVKSGGITGELNKEPSLHCSFIYITYMWSMLQQYLSGP